MGGRMRRTVQIILNGAIVSEQKNLRAIMDYSLKHRVVDVTVCPIEPGNIADKGAILIVKWRDGATCTTDFADFGLCKTYAKRLAKRHSATLTVGHKAGDGVTQQCKGTKS